LLADIKLRRIKVVVVYKVDRLTRSLADFAKLVELFDAHGVSFVSVTQAFNTTSSMGRLTLNVLLSFAQFEREVTGERIRDKIAASKRKGMWMGGFAPIGYLPHERTLVIDPAQAERVRAIFRLYLELGCVGRLKLELDRRAWLTPQRQGRRPGGGRAFTRGHLYRLLANPIYIGQITHKGVPFPGQHPGIIDADLWQAVQERLKANLNGHRNRTNASHANLLAGLTFDDQGRRLAPTHATKGARRYRYYIGPTSAAAGEAPAHRIPAQELEGAVLAALVNLLHEPSRLMALMGHVDADVARSRLRGAAALADALSAASTERVQVIRRLVARIAVGVESISIDVRTAAIWSGDVERAEGESTTSLLVPVQLKRCGPAVRLIVRAPYAPKTGSPDPRLIALLAKAQRWFTSLASGRRDSVLSIAQEHRMASAEVTRVVYLAFLAPDIVERIVCGERPIDLNIKRLLAMAPLPMDWAEQRRVLGFDR
jgi:hypothetical protein